MIGTLLELFWSCTKIGLLAFGGGNAAIPLLEAEAVPRWISEQEFGELVGINFAFPGITLLKLAGMVGLRAAGPPGLLVAIIGIALPGLVLTIGEGRPGPDGATAGPSSTRPRLVSSPIRSAMVERFSPVVAVSSERERGPWRWRLSRTTARL